VHLSCGFCLARNQQQSRCLTNSKESVMENETN
jgi:hypothetical protein